MCYNSIFNSNNNIDILFFVISQMFLLWTITVIGYKYIIVNNIRKEDILMSLNVSPRSMKILLITICLLFIVEWTQILRSRNPRVLFIGMSFLFQAIRIDKRILICKDRIVYKNCVIIKNEISVVNVIHANCIVIEASDNKNIRIYGEKIEDYLQYIRQGIKY